MNNRKQFEKWFLKKYGWLNAESWHKDFYEDQMMQDHFVGWNAFAENLGALQIAPDLKIYGTDEALTLAGKALAAYKKNEEIIKNSKRYVWLRDISVPPHNFYLSVPVEFADVKYSPQEVDAAIDAALKD